MKTTRILSSPAIRAATPASRGGKHRTRLAPVATAIVLAAGAAAAAEPELPGAWHVGPTPEVRAVCHAGDSLWVGTGAGVFIFDIRNPSRRAHIGAGRELASSSVRAIAARGDSVWVGTDTGLTLFRGGTATVFSPRTPGKPGEARLAYPVRYIHHIAFGSGGEVLLSTRRGGVGVLSAAGGYAITRRDSLVGDDVFGVLEREGRPRLYACAAGLCAQVDDTTFVSFQAGAGLPRGEVRQVVGDARTAFVRIARRGIYQFDGKQATPITAPPGATFADATSISFGADGALWVAGPGFIFVRRDGRWKRVETPEDSGASWRVIEADGSGAFAGSAGGVVRALDRGTDFRVTLGDGLPAPAVSSLRPDGRGGAWFVSGGRVLSADPSRRRLAVENSPPDAEAVDFSPQTGLLVASRWTVSRKDPAGWTDLRPDVAENDPAFSAVHVDADHVIWVGARSGALYRYDGEIWLRYARPLAPSVSVRDARAYPADEWAVLGSAVMQNSSGSWSPSAGWAATDAVVDVAVSPAGEWVAATKDRLYRYDALRGRWDAGPRIAAASMVPFTAVTFDPGGRLFIGTTDGFGCVSRGGEQWWNVTDGIGGEHVNDLMADATMLWVGYANDGLSVIPLAGLR
jgi:ligand-binding sensor domain-containing protein